MPIEPRGSARPARTAGRLFLILCGTVVAAELLAHLLVGVLPPLPHFVAAWIDALLLLGLASPVLYVIVLRPRDEVNTEREEMSALLLQREMQLRATLGSTIDGILAVDNEGKVLHTSRRFAELWRIPGPVLELGDDRALLDVVLHQLIEPDIFLQKVQSLYDSDAESVDTLRFKDGRVYERYSSPMITNGVRTGRVWSFRDVTARQRADLERQVLHEVAQGVATTSDLDDLLALIHRSLRKVLDAENCFVALHDGETGLYSFPYFVDQYDEVPPPVAMPESCTAYVFRRGKPALITPVFFRQLQAQQEVALVGSPSPSWMGVPLRTPSGMMGVLVVQHYEKEGIYSEQDLGFLADVGNQAAVVIERKQAELALRDREAELAVILESTADGILAVDGTGKVIKTNKRFAELWRVPTRLVDSRDEEALLRHVVSQLANPEAFLAKVRSMYGSTEEDRDTVRFRDGRVVESHSAPILKDGAITGRVFSFHDITARLQAEAAAVALETQLRNSQRLESVGLLAGGVSHEFNNMLAVILGNTELALAQLEPSQQVHADLVEVRKAAQRSADLARQLLAFARSQPVAPRVMDMNEMAPALLTKLQRLVGDDIQVVWPPTSQLWPILMDPSQMEQILTNLVANSQHAIAGVGTVTIAMANRVIDAAYCATHTGVVPGEYVQLTVTDTGSGMDTATVSRIYEPFFTTKEIGKGTGLGLAMVYGAVKQNGGFIIVTSAPGAGTSFEIHLPRSGADPRP